MNRMTTFASVAALACMSAAEPAAATDTPANPAILNFELPSLEGERTFDVSTIPADDRLAFLKGAVRTYIANRVNSHLVRHNKDPKVIAWAAFDEATKADPLQSLVAKPEGERPAAPDLEATLAAALADLSSGNIRKLSADPKPRTRKDPLIVLVTKAVVRDVFDGRKALDPKYTYPMATAEVGSDGVEYLNKMIEAKVAAGAVRADLEKVRDTRYIGPAKMMLGMTTNKSLDALPSIL